MYKTIRKKVASTVSEIEKTEDFAWGKWLKEPTVQEHSVEEFETPVINPDQYNSWLDKPAFQKKKFDFKDVFIFPEPKNLQVKKSKTHTVFFSLIKPEVKKLKLFDNEFKLEHKPEKIELTGITVKLKEVKWNLPQTKVEQKKCELKSSILKNKLLDAYILVHGDIAVEEFKSNFKTLITPAKIYKVKIISLDKIRLGKIYYLKNISLHDVRILRESLALIEKPEVNLEEIKYFLTEEEIKAEILKEEISVEELTPVALEDISDTMIEILEKEEYQLPDNISEENTISIVEEEIIPEVLNEEKIDEQVAVEEIVENKEEIKKEKKPDLNEPDLPEAKVSVGQESNIVEDESAKENEESEDVDEDECETEFESLYGFQEEGAEFLLGNKKAVLYDEMGLGKTIQVISAIKNLFVNKKIKSAVVVCDTNEIGNRNKINGDVAGWLGHFHQRAPELKIEQGKPSSQERSKQWKNLPDVLIISYENILFDVEENIIDAKELKKNICIVIDEIQNLDFKNYNKQKFLKLVSAKYVWAISSYPEVELKEKLDKTYKEKNSFKNYLGRTRSEVENDFTKIAWENKWLTLDEEQIADYKEAFDTAKEKVQWLLESGNPLRFNANVFTLLHQLKQVCNFSEKKGRSRKTEILLQQVDRIARNNQKVVIFSQYDKAGVKKIEDVLKKNNINFLSYAPGMSTKDMETVLKNFSSNSSITALVTGVKPSKIKIPSGNISYVIHFDLWWNPTYLWQTEESLTGSLKEGERKFLNIYSYMMKNTVEERINSLLFNKGFLNKWIMETVNPDSLTEMITNPEWLEIFDMPDEEYKQKFKKGLVETEKRIDNYSTEELIEKCKNFYTKLGYKNLAVTLNKSEDYFNIRGIYKKTKFDQQMCARVLSKNSVPEEEVKSHITELKEITNKGKFFLITKGSFDVNENFSHKDLLINQSLLAKYFYQFIII